MLIQPVICGMSGVLWVIILLEDPVVAFIPCIFNGFEEIVLLK